MSLKTSKKVIVQFERVLEIGKLYGFYRTGAVLIPKRLFFVLAIGAFEQVMMQYSLYDNWPNIPYVCNILCIFCANLLLVLRLISRIVKNDDELVDLCMATMKTAYERDERNEKLKAIIEASLETSAFVVKAYFILWFVIFNSLSVSAWIISWYTGELILFTPIYVPYTDPHSLSGYIFNSMLMCCMVMVAYVVFMTVDITSIYFSLQSRVMADVYCAKWRELNEKLKKNNRENQKPPAVNRIITLIEMAAAKKTEKAFEKILKENIKTLIKEFREYDEFLRAAFNYMEFQSFSMITVNALAIAMSLVIVIFYSKAIGMLAVTTFGCQVLVPCIQGTVARTQKEKILNELYSFPWYELKNTDQKIFLSLLHMCQQSMEYKVYVIGDLKMELFVQVMNGVYSYFMFLWNFIKIN